MGHFFFFLRHRGEFWEELCYQKQSIDDLYGQDIGSEKFTVRKRKLKREAYSGIVTQCFDVLLLFFVLITC